MTKFKQSGQILILVFIALGVMLFTVLFVIAGSQVYYQNAQYSYTAESAAAIAEAGADKAIVSLNKTAGSYSGEPETILGEGSFSVTITTKDAATKVIESVGYIPNKGSPKVKRTVKVQASKGVGIAFNYGLQVGQGGLTMGNSAILNGSIYSNGSIIAGNTTSITGDVYVAGGTQAAADQQNQCIPPNCLDFIFGKIAGAELDVGMSFKPLTNGVLNKVEIRLKKIGSPPNAVVRILSDNNGSPNKNDVKANGTLNAGLVTSDYGFVEVSFTSSPLLNANTSYWLMIDTSANSGNYWAWEQDLAQSYTRGAPKWSANWNSPNPVWVNITADLGFKTYMGGVSTKIETGNGGLLNGNVHANTILGGGGTVIKKDAYYQVIGPNVAVEGSSFPGSADSPPQTFPISQAQISGWKNEAENTGVTSGSLSYGNGCIVTLGPRKITGSVSFGNGCTVTIKSPVWIQGAMSVGNTTIFKLDPSLGASSGIIIVDGATSMGNGCDLKGTGVAGSYLMLLSTYLGTAIDMGNSSISGIVYAPSGTVNLSNGASFKEIVANGIIMGNSAVLNYETGLINTFFTSGPSGSFTLVKGTYQVK